MKNLFLLFSLFLCLAGWANVHGQTPSYTWGLSWGSPANDAFISIELDSQSNVYVASRFKGTIDVDPGPDTVLVTSGNNGIRTSVYIIKFDRDGRFLWVKTIDSSLGADMSGIVRCPDGNFLVIGLFTGVADFDPGPDQFLITANAQDAFLMKMDPDGTFLWAKAIGGSGDEYFSCVSFDQEGNIITGGLFFGTADLDPGPDESLFTFMGHAVDGIDIFAAKYSSTGDYIWGEQFPGDSRAFFNDLIVGKEGNPIFIGAFYDSRDFDPGPDSTKLITAGQGDIFMLSLNADGIFQRVLQMGGIGDESGNGFVQNEKGDLMIAGSFNEEVDFDPGPGLQLVSPNHMDAFLLSLDQNWAFKWLRTFGGSSNDFARVIRKDPADNLYIIGNFADTVDFDPGTEVHALSDIGHTGKPDAFILKFDPTGDYRWAYQLGGPGADRGLEVRFGDEGKEIFLTGLFEQKALLSPGLTGMDTVSAIGLRDVFLAKWNQCDATTSEQSIQSCSAAFISPSGNYVWTSEGDFMDTLINSRGCDSVLLIHLSFVHIDTVLLKSLDEKTLVANEVSADTYQWVDCNAGYATIAGETLSEFTPAKSGVYAVIMEKEGCVDTSECLFICVETNAEISPFSCGLYITPNGNHILSESGTYLDTLTNKAGCDSIITIHLTVSDLGLTITQQGDTLFGDGGVKGIFWLDCDHGFAQLATGEQFTPGVNGHYAISGSGFVCTDTSACFAFVMTATHTVDIDQAILIYPNPVKKVLNIDLKHKYPNVNIDIYTATGIRVYQQTSHDQEIIPVESKLDPGIYFVSINTGQKIILQKFVVD
ncbi:MAG: T9SS type A sorting domain-containing protein [Saprospiraceae bacterium]